MAGQRRGIIIGGGIAGPALGLFLRRAGVDATIYESYPKPARSGAGLGMGPNGMNVLAALGLAERVVARGTSIREICFRTARGGKLARFPGPSPTKYGFPTVGMDRQLLYDLLLGALAEQHIPVLYGRRLVAVKQTQRSVEAEFADGSKSEADFLIGADGIHSAVRASVFPDSPKPGYLGLVGVGAILPASAVPAVTEADRLNFNYSYGRNGFVGFCGGSDGKVMWWSNLPREKPYTREELEQVPTEEVKREMLGLFGDYHPPLPALIEATQQMMKVNLFDVQSLPKWSNGRVLLIGDAAHAVSPNSGQGAAMALEDAMYLAKLLKDAEAYEQVFARFEQERKPRVERIVAEGRRRGADKVIVGPFQQRIRETIMRIVLPLFGPNGDDWMYRYRIDWEVARAA